jgi:crotonyl-CoA carboxylase/reductase
MKALFFEEFSEETDVLQYGEVADPEPGPNDVLVRVKASALNYNDIWARRGRPLKVPLPHISGTDAAGVVEGIGDAVSTVAVGDEVVVHAGHSCRVCDACTRGEEFFCRRFQLYGFQTGPVQGTHAELCVIQEAQAVSKPSGLSFEEAAAVPLCLTTAWRMLVTRARIQQGDVVLVWGAAGGLGVYALQIARNAGAVPIGVVGSEAKAELAHELGAEHVIDRSKEDVPDAVARLTSKAGVDIVFEHTGEATWEASVKACRWGGTIVVCGATTGFEARTDLRFLWNKQQSHLGSHVGSRAETEAAIAELAHGKIRPVIDRVLPLSEGAEAQRLMEAGEVAGKIVHVP